MSGNCPFSLHAPNSHGFVEDRAFSCFAQAQEGDFTVGQNELNKVAEILAYNWVYMRVTPDTVAARYVCQQLGFNYDSLFDEEVDYLKLRVEEEIRLYECS